MNHSQYIPTDQPFIERLCNVQSKNITTVNGKHIILNYFEPINLDHDKRRRFYNSVVIDPETRKILSIASPLSYDFELFQKSFNNVDENILAEEMIEGVSIQLFYDPRIKKWEISTRNSVSGNYAYYRLPGQSSKTYRDMFFDAMGIIGENRQIEQWTGFKHLLTTNCYHFIVTHPDNHLVLKTKSPQLYFTGYYELHCNNVNDVRYRHSSEEPLHFPSGLVKIPEQIIPQNHIYDHVIKKFMSSYGCKITMGMSFLNKQTGERCFIITPEYKHLQQIRGTHPNLLYQYLCLKRINKIHEFLGFFPQYTIFFNNFQNMYDNLIRDFHQSYFHYYIRKSNPVLDKSISFHIHKIHETIYKPSLNDAVKTIIKNDIVRKYVDTLEPGCTMHLLRRELYITKEVIKDTSPRRFSWQI